MAQVRGEKKRKCQGIHSFLHTLNAGGTVTRRVLPINFRPGFSPSVHYYDAAGENYLSSKLVLISRLLPALFVLCPSVIRFGRLSPAGALGSWNEERATQSEANVRIYILRILLRFRFCRSRSRMLRTSNVNWASVDARLTTRRRRLRLIVAKTKTSLSTSMKTKEDEKSERCEDKS